MQRADTIEDAEALALRALTWTLSDTDRAMRLLSLTGLTPDDLRERIGTRPILAAGLGFLAAHEPDLIACADHLGTKPEALARALAELDR